MPQMIRFIQITSILILFLGHAWAADSVNTLERSGLWGYEPSGIAIRGFDTVAYFTLGKPVKGNKAFEQEWMGVKWYFSSQKHLELFITDPKKYAPQYGGYCAYGVASDNLVKIEGDVWDIIDGKLYLNFDKNVQDKWREDISGFIQIANMKFDRLLVEK